MSVLKNCLSLVPRSAGLHTTAYCGQIPKPKDEAKTKYFQMPPTSFIPEAYDGRNYEDTMAIRKKSLSPSLVTFYRKPVFIHQGKMQWLWDDQGKRYLDFFGGIVTVSVGHCHPKVNEALTKQINKLWHTTSIYLQPQIHEYAARLVEKLPDPLSVVMFTNSGSEANDLAMYMARLYTGNHDIISFRNSYHGMSPYTMGLTAHSSWKFKVPTGSGITHAMNPDPYQGLWGGSHCRDSPVQTTRTCNAGCPPDACFATDKYIDQLEEVFRYSCPKGESVAALFAESIQGVGGSVQFPVGYLKKAFARVRELGGVCISDEVQTGFGRTGDHFWGFEGHDVIPDMVTMAKGIGNGFPLAAVVTTPEIAATMGTDKALYFNTYSGNPLASTVGMAVLDAIEEDKCQETSLEVGTYLMHKLAEVRDKHQIIGDVRGKGLMIGIEMVLDKDKRTPLPADTMVDVWENMKEEGVLIGKGGFFGNVFRIKPPMCITKQDVDFAVDVFDDAVTRAENNLK